MVSELFYCQQNRLDYSKARIRARVFVIIYKCYVGNLHAYP